MRTAGRISGEKADIERAEESLEAVQQQFSQLEEDFKTETAAMRERFNLDRLEIDEEPIRPRKADLSVDQITLVWTPWAVDLNGVAQPAY
jgi:hypothetical protein